MDLTPTTPLLATAMTTSIVDYISSQPGLPGLPLKARMLSALSTLEVSPKRGNNLWDAPGDPKGSLELGVFGCESLFPYRNNSLIPIKEFLAEKLSVSYFSVPSKYPARKWPSLRASGHVSSLTLLLESLLVTVVRCVHSSTLSLSLWHSDTPTCLTAPSPKRREPLTLGGSFDPLI